jgi:hypothetical protein
VRGNRPSNPPNGARNRVTDLAGMDWLRWPFDLPLSAAATSFACAVWGMERRFHLGQRHARWQDGLGGCAPREPCHLHRLRPERERVGALDKAAERLERGHV